MGLRCAGLGFLVSLLLSPAFLAFHGWLCFVLHRFCGRGICLESCKTSVDLCGEAWSSLLFFFLLEFVVVVCTILYVSSGGWFDWANIEQELVVLQDKCWFCKIHSGLHYTGVGFWVLCFVFDFVYMICLCSSVLPFVLMLLFPDPFSVVQVVEAGHIWLCSFSIELLISKIQFS